MLLIYGLTIFLGATLLFLVQPLFAKLALPLLGGTPAVWSTCMVFFQACLLAGYLYAHFATKWLGARKHALVHLGVMLLPAIVLPIALPSGWSPPTESNPTIWLLALLSVSVGLPFFVVSASNPMLQKWFATSGHPAGKDPYFLYAASNLGSMLALLGYPFLLEPNLTLSSQGAFWALGYALLVACTATCGVCVWKRQTVTSTSMEQSEISSAEVLSFKRRARWVFLAFIPSSLMLGVTTHIATDVASFPLLWVIPLSLYLLTFVLVFAKRPPLRHQWMIKALPWLALPVAMFLSTSASQGAVYALIVLNLLMFFVASMVCHGEMAADRPSTKHLTEFYLWMSVGGVLGGMFNALIAPVVFNGIMEYSIAMILACVILPGTKLIGSRTEARILDVALPVGLLVAVGALTWMSGSVHDSPVAKLLIVGVPAAICFTFAERPIRFGLGLAALMTSALFHSNIHEDVLHVERTFFGVHRVHIGADGRFKKMVHGTTVHGLQHTEKKYETVPISYYYPTGPVGYLFEDQQTRKEEMKVAIVGLGCGAMIGYHRPEDRFTFYEIDPAVKRIAEDPNCFTYLSSAKDNAYSVVLGDGRLTLGRAKSAEYDLIFLDAFSSDAVPTHLMTREALQLYKQKLKDDGVITFNISNRYIDLESTLGDLAASEGLACLSCPELIVSEDEFAMGKASCHFIMMSRDAKNFGSLTQRKPWFLLKPTEDGKPWTDDYSNILDVLRL